MLVGAGITAVIQSSSATTVMVVGFVNSGMMTLRQAVWIIMGANIGTTITGQLIALDVARIAPLLAFVGVALVVFIKKPSAPDWGQIVAGLGVLFIGMDMMSDSMKPPAGRAEVFINLMTSFRTRCSASWSASSSRPLSSLRRPRSASCRPWPELG